VVGLDDIELSGLSLTMLSPSIDVIQMLVDDWTAFAIKEKRDNEASNAPTKVTADLTVDLKSVELILAEKEIVKKWENDLINSSSVAFIAEYEDDSILFLGDSNPDLILERFDKLNITDLNPRKFNLVKVSHHGSAHNTTVILLKRIKANIFLFSTVGTGASYHPHRETLIRICEYSTKLDESIKREFLFNYELNYDKLMTKAERKKYDVEFKLVDEFKI
jgi:beta-lactamase superfamily II metal-dependent hydrolase